MARTVAIGVQDFEKLIQGDCFYIDKTMFIKNWWESTDEVTLITRPRRFGKTLTMSMLERFFSNRYQGQGEIFEGLDIWKDEKYRELQGSYPVIFLSFASVKENTFDKIYWQICEIIEKIYTKHRFLLESSVLTEQEKDRFQSIGIGMPSAEAAFALHNLSDYLYRYYGKKVIILLDEYDTPLQEAYVNGCWDKIIVLMRNLFNATFKTNPCLERAVMTGITRVSKESMFSDLNNLRVVSMVSEEYASYFGFTETEVFTAMEEYGLTNQEEVKFWYDGFTIGNLRGIYNPWSIINFLRDKKLKSYWANTSSNRLAGSLIRTGDKEMKMQFEDLLQGRSIYSKIDEEVVFNQLDEQGDSAVWSLLFASGYLKVNEIQGKIYELELTNHEVRDMFETMVSGWFAKNSTDYNGFIRALLRADVEEMNAYMEEVAQSMFSSFDGGEKPSARTPERFYHGFVLGLLVDLKDRYEISSNRESGFGRYDVMLKPLHEADDAIIMEFKIYNSKKEKDMEETVQNALQQITEKHYEQTLLDQGIHAERIRKYGFAFRGKEVLIG
ncbi:MAG: ATP-binding protein, partial [Clostridium sp.]|nr:ATP-binding protein [Clostridium sp.]